MYVTDKASEFNHHAAETESAHWRLDNPNGKADAYSFYEGARWQWESARTQVACCLVRIGELESQLAAAEDLIAQFADQGFVKPAEYDDYFERYKPKD